MPEGTDLLCDWSACLNALMDAYNGSPDGGQYLKRAEEAFDQMEKRFFDRARGAYFDIEADDGGVGYMRLREKPLAENVQIVEALLKIHHATGEARYQLRAENVLSAFVDANRDFGEHAATYAVAVDRFLHPPVEITVEGDPEGQDTQRLFLAACRVSHPHVIVKPVTVAAGASALAHVCVDTLCFPPVSQPGALAESVAEALNGPQNPVGSIFENFISF